MDILSIKNLSKNYSKFSLKGVSFSLESGYIMGFIGRNGAGKTTTLKTMLNLVHSDGGKVEMFGLDFSENEYACKQKLGCVFGGVDYYPGSKLKTIASTVSHFYDEWDDALFKDYLKRFELDENKRVRELSDGMRVKFALALALSHNASLLILDEPTSGLDPVSRDELLDLFQELIESGERSILFSTHITSDLEKCADYITYIKDGEILASTERDTLVERYRIIRGAKSALTDELAASLIGVKKTSLGFEGLALANALPSGDGLEILPSDLESIMIHFEKEDK